MLLYNLSIWLYSAALNLASLWNPKAKAWVDGRKGLLDRMEVAFSEIKGRKRIWMHCASLGEFEQGRPVLEALRNQYPDAYIMVTFFSPSGYEIRKNYPVADHVFYLPVDRPSNARKFIDILQPDLAIFVKYEYWLNLLRVMKKKGIPVLMISALFQHKQIFFQWYGYWFKKALKGFRHFFVQNQESSTLLSSAGIHSFSITGDTRFDRVLSITENFTELPLIKNFCNTAFAIVAGSTWEEDEEVWTHLVRTRQDIRFIFAPHELYKDHLKSIERLFPRRILYSELAEGIDVADSNVLVIDNFGMLSRLYHYGTICYIGGGFSNGIHNILEAAVHGKPLIFGPAFYKFQEAVDLLELGGAETVESAIELEKIVAEWLTNPVEMAERGTVSSDYVKERAGATKKIIRYIQEKRLLTS
jgi:3-deoxy-D-manno-octulosonic-acid transferase